MNDLTRNNVAAEAAKQVIEKVDSKALAGILGIIGILGTLGWVSKKLFKIYMDHIGNNNNN